MLSSYLLHIAKLQTVVFIISVAVSNIWSGYQRAQQVAQEVRSVEGEAFLLPLPPSLLEWLESWPTLEHVSKSETFQLAALRIGRRLYLQRLGGVMLEAEKLDSNWLERLKALQSLRHLAIYGATFKDGEALTDQALRNLDLPNLQILVVGSSSAVTGGFLDEFPNVELLDLRYSSGLDDHGMKNIGDLKHLNHLVLEHAHLPSGGIKHLSGLIHLTYLDMSETQIDDAGLYHLRGLSNLETLEVGNTRVGGSGLKYLSGLPKLEWLNLENCPVGDNGLTDLKDLRHLEWLDLSGTNVTDEGLKQVAKVTTLTGVGLKETKVTGSGVAHLTALNNLLGLDLKGSSLTDENLKALARARPQQRPLHSRLRSIDVRNTKVTTVGVELLKKAFPGMSVTYDETE